MARKDPPEEPLLFDLPLAKGGEGQAERSQPQAPPARPRERKSGSEHLRPLELPLDAPTTPASDEEGLPSSGTRAARSSRFLAGMADLVAHGAVGVLGVMGARQIGIRPRLADWPGFAVFLLAFSFLYVVVSLAFWGHTLGMAWAGITARSRDGEALSFDQAVRRWLGGLVSSALLGLPLLLSLRGRALSDFVSSSETVRRPDGAD